MEKEQYIGKVLIEAVINVTKESNPTLEKLPVVILENFKYRCNVVANNTVYKWGKGC